MEEWLTASPEQDAPMWKHVLRL